MEMKASPTPSVAAPAMKPFTFILLVWIASLVAGLNNFGSTLPMFQLFVLRHELHLSIFQLEWVVLATWITPTVIFMTLGQFSDKFGGFPIFILACLIFAVSSLLIGLAPNGTMLLVGEFVLGIAMGFAYPSALALLKYNAPSPVAEKRAVIIFMVCQGIMNALAIVLGVVFAQYLSWRLAYVVMTCVSLIGLLLIVLMRKQLKKRTVERKIDYLGTVLLAIGLSLLLYAISDIQNVGWSALVITLMSCSIVILSLFLVLEYFIKDPLFNYSLYKKSNVWIGIIMVSIIGVPICVFPYFYNLFVQDQALLNYSVSLAGYTFLPYQVALFTVGLLCVICRRRLTFLWLIGVGCLLTSIAYILFLVFGNAGYAFLWWKLLLLGIGLGLAFSLALPYTLSFINSKYSGEAGGTICTIASVAATLGIAIGHNIYYGGMKDRVSSGLHHLRLSASLSKTLINASHAKFTQYPYIVEQHFGKLSKAAFLLMRQALETAYFRSNIFQLALFVVALALTIVLLVMHVARNR
jgi:MFS family permease